MDLSENTPAGFVAQYDAQDRNLLAAIQPGLPLVSRPYAEIGKQLGMPEAEVIARIDRLKARGVIKRFGVVVRHHELGYRANAMVVWDVPDEEADYLGHCLGKFEFVTLCYRRARHLPEWRYNLYCMIHGRDRGAVLEQLALLIERCGLQEVRHEVLFSRRRFKQCGAAYATAGMR
jgi:DNA-binding Lrp family transcriptional regulator